ncbi:MAG TPA: anhydro-N-acetylmuramic acid kinase [Roseiarcus sp.]|nr:anhydro-N-acetylmuramic acid kinase [Roseiarcus sp.]
MTRAIGVISGTSMDGIDVALIDGDGEAIASVGPGATYPYAAELAERLRAVVADPVLAAGPLEALERDVTDAHVAAVESFLTEHAIARAGVALVGLHGQTVLHRPQQRYTRQLCDGGRAARRLGADVVCDFRSADVAAGGEGAPLVPLYHAALAAGLERPLMVLNWGGVGNVTYLGRAGEIVAFDTGPANAPLDDFMRRRRGLAHDENGALAASGKVDAALVAAWMEDAYFRRPAPKSLDRNHFQRLTAGAEALSDADGAATLAAFTVEATAAALAQTPEPPKRWLVCGGGRRNANLMARLARRLGVAVEPIEAIGEDGDFVEAACFAHLALRSRRGLPLSLPSTTGAPRPLTGGAYWPRPSDSHA